MAKSSCSVFKTHVFFHRTLCTCEKKIDGQRCIGYLLAQLVQAHAQGCCLCCQKLKIKMQYGIPVVDFNVWPWVEVKTVLTYIDGGVTYKHTTHCFISLLCHTRNGRTYVSCTWHTTTTRVFHCICVRYSITNPRSIIEFAKWMIAHNWYQPHDNCTKIVLLYRAAILRWPAHYTYAFQVSSRKFLGWVCIRWRWAVIISFALFCCYSRLSILHVFFCVLHPWFYLQCTLERSVRCKDRDLISFNLCFEWGGDLKRFFIENIFELI